MWKTIITKDLEPMINKQDNPNTSSATAIVTAQHNAGYVSPLEKINSYNDLLRAGELFAASQLVPAAFKGKPGDCAIAFDLAMRLNLNPLSIFQQLYIINGRPSLSAQYMIALVNRSGRFTCVNWDEGIDGDVEFSSYGKTRKIPNYYATAFFKSVETGEILKSTRVDVRLALTNGWLSKDGSKWQTIPAQMCRYRSAAFLIRSYAPEIAMGLPFSDELEDINAPQPAAPVQVTTVTMDAENIDVDVAQVMADNDVEELKNKIAAADTLDELKVIGETIAAATIEAAQLCELRRLYLARKKELESASIAAQPVVKDDEPAPPVELATQEKQAPKTRKRAATKNKTSFDAQAPLPSELIDDNTPQPGEDKLIELNLGTRLNAAETTDDVDVIVGEILDACDAEKIDEKTRNRLITGARKIYAEIADIDVDDTTTSERETTAEGLRVAMEQAAADGDSGALKCRLRAAYFLFVHGNIAASQCVNLVTTYNDLKSGDK